MPKFVVTYRADQRRPGCSEVDIVEADYHRVEGGALIFRTHARHHENNGYPATVHVFAAGVWAEVENSND